MTGEINEAMKICICSKNCSMQVITSVWKQHYC